MQGAYPENSIPTPPFSPGTCPSALPDEDTAQGSLESTVELVDSLIAFYEQKRSWITRTRERLGNGSFPSETQGLSPPFEHDDLGDGPPYDQPDGQENSGSPRPNTRWTKRKKGFKMHLEGLSSKPKPIHIVSTHPVGQQGPMDMPIPSREEILANYERMLELRMESCQTLKRLVQSANRASLHNR